MQFPHDWKAQIDVVELREAARHQLAHHEARLTFWQEQEAREQPASGSLDNSRTYENKVREHTTACEQFQLVLRYLMRLDPTDKLPVTMQVFQDFGL